VEGDVEFMKLKVWKPIFRMFSLKNTLFQASFSILSYTYAFITYNIMLNRWGNSQNNAEAGRLLILARGRSKGCFKKNLTKVFGHILELQAPRKKSMVFFQGPCPC
jgi:hypothetical protein